MKPCLLRTLILCFVVSACNQSTTKQSSKDQSKQRIDDYILEATTRLKIPGVTVAATRNDTIVYQGAFGYRNLDNREPMKVSYDFHWASVSKTFVATAIMQLVEQGKIDLDEKITTYIPYFKQQDKEYKDITIRQMLNHTSGIGDVDDYEWDKPQNDEGAPARFVKGLENDKMLFAPGKDWSYSNTAYEILGVVITTVSGMPFETYIRKNIFEPLEMFNTSFIYPEIPDSLRVSGHIWAGKPQVSKVYPYNRIHAPSSTLNSNVIEMTHYAIANLHHGDYHGHRILSDSTYSLLWKNSVHLPDTTAPKVGLSWFLGSYDGIETVSHSGGDTGFSSFLLLVPDKNISVEVVSNYELTDGDAIAYAVLDILLGRKPKISTLPIGYAFSERLVSDGLEKAKLFYNETNADSTKRKYFTWENNSGVVRSGNLLLEHGLLNESLQVLTFGAELFPQSAYAQASLGRAHAKSGDKDNARKYIRKAIELAPGVAYYENELKKLGK
jgi:CubicO group peptidase (beta-lactamase class C family)